MRGGIVGKDEASSRPLWHPNTISFPASDEVVLLWTISNFDYGWGGALSAPRLGVPKALSLQREFTRLREGTLLGLIGIVGLYHLILFGLRPSDRGSLWLGLFCLQIAGRT